MGRTIKISEENYRWLLDIAGELEKEKGRRTSFDEALKNLKEKKGKKKKKSILDLAGRWEDMSDKEAEKLKKSLRTWGKWEIPSW